MIDRVLDIDNKELNPKEKRILIIIWIFSILCLCIALVIYISTKPIMVTFIDVGQGDSCLINGGRDGNVLIDGGDEGSGKILREYFNHNYVFDLDAVFITHFHNDHISGIKELIEDDFPIRKIYVSKTSEEFEEDDEIKRLASEKGIDIEEICVGRYINVGKVKYTVLWPQGTEDENKTNNSSLVLRCDYGENSFLFTGDIEKNTEKCLINMCSEDLDIDVLKVAHHGSNTSTQTDFLKICTPEFAVISVGYNNQYGNPSSKTLFRLENNSNGVFRTDYNGTIVFTINEEKIKRVDYNNKFR